MTSGHSPVGIVYLRRSTDLQEESLETQLNWAINRSKSEPYKLKADAETLRVMLDKGHSQSLDLYVDDAISGAEKDRPGLKALLKRLGSNPSVGAVYCWSVDRLGRFRKALDGASLVHTMLDSGACIISESKVITPPETRDGRLSSLITSIVDSHISGDYLYQLAASVLRGQEQNAKRGNWNGGEPTYGFARFLVENSTGKKIRQLQRGERIKQSGHSTAIAPGEDQESKKRLETVRLIHDLYCTGTGIGAVAAELNRRGIPTPHAGRTRKGKMVSEKWSLGTVRNILENPAYISKIAWARTSQGTHYRYVTAGSKGARQLSQREPIEVNRERESWQLATPRISYDPVVSLDLWEANYTRIRERGVKDGQRGLAKSRENAPFAIGKVICGTCGNEMVATTKDLLPAFVCGTYQRTKPKECNHNWVYRDQVLWFISETLRRYCDTTKAPVRSRLKKAIERQLCGAGPESSSKELERLHADREKAERLLEKTLEQKLEYDQPSVIEVIDKKIREYGREITGIDRQLRQIDKAAKLRSSDLGQEVEAALAVLDDWNLLTECAPAKKLQRLLGVIRPQVTV